MNNSLIIGLIVLVVMLVAAFAGIKVRDYLPKHFHIGPERFS
jgi:hypothetical protein